MSLKHIWKTINIFKELATYCILICNTNNVNFVTAIPFSKIHHSVRPVILNINKIDKVLLYLNVYMQNCNRAVRVPALITTSVKTEDVLLIAIV